MTPYTMHFLGQFIRHQKAMVTSGEKWIASPSFSVEEAREALAYIRKVLDAYERSLGSVVISE